MLNEKLLSKLGKLTNQTIIYGQKIQCLNPNHDDKTPSMHVYKDRAYCWGCGYCITAASAKKESKADIIAKRFIEEASLNPPSEFTAERKYDPETIKQLGIGLCTTQTYNTLLNEIDKKYLKQYGYLNSKGQHVYVNRVIVPFDDTYFSARSSSKDSTQTKNLFPKGQDKRPFIISGQRGFIVTEGETSAIAAKHLYPKATILGIGGTGNTRKFFDEIEEYTSEKTVFLCFDNDEAGQKATQTALEICKIKEMEIKLIYFDPEYNDIDDLYREHLLGARKLISERDFTGNDIFLEKDFKPLSKAELKVKIDKEFPLLWDTMDLCISVVCVNKLAEWSDPVGVQLVGKPSGEKTTVLSMFYGINGLVYKSDSFTPKSFVSHIQVPDEELADIDLLPRIKDKCIIVPELAPIFGKRKEDLLENMSMLTRVFDGEGLESDSGSKGQRGYSGEYLFTWLGATTPIQQHIWKVMGKLGARWFFKAIPESEKDDDELMSIVTSGKNYGTKIRECREETHRFIKTIYKDGKRTVAWDDTKNEPEAAKVIMACAQLLKKLRATIDIWKGDDGKEEWRSPLVEKPYRIMNVLMNIAKGHAISEDRKFISKEDMPLIVDLMLGSMPDDRMKLFKMILARKNESFDKNLVMEVMNVSESSAFRTLHTLEILEIIQEKEGFSVGNQEGKSYITHPETLKYIGYISSYIKSEEKPEPLRQNDRGPSSPRQGLRQNSIRDIKMSTTPCHFRGGVPISGLVNWLDENPGSGYDEMECNFPIEDIAEALSKGWIMEYEKNRFKITGN